MHMNSRRVGEDRGSKEMDGCPLTVIAVNLGLPFLSLLSRLRLRSEGLQTRAIRMYGACQIMTLLVSGCFP
jgi:hypothetical protein